MHAIKFQTSFCQYTVHLQSSKKVHNTSLQPTAISHINKYTFRAEKWQIVVHIALLQIHCSVYY